MTRILKSLSFCLGALWLASVARADEPAIIAKARAYLGSEAALSSVHSVHFVGTISADNPKDPAHPTHARLEMIIQRPYQLRLQATYDKVTEIDGLNGYDGWHRHEDNANPALWRQVVLAANDIKQMRTNIWQNLAFYRSFDREGPQIEDRGSVQVDGVRTRKVAFIHDSRTVFYRFFDERTGKLVVTETESGSQIKEEGEIVEAGIRFPRKLITVFTGRNGAKDQTVVLEFDRVSVNETFPDSLFSVPAPLPLSKH